MTRSRYPALHCAARAAFPLLGVALAVWLLAVLGAIMVGGAIWWVL